MYVELVLTWYQICNHSSIPAVSIGRFKDMYEFNNGYPQHQLSRRRAISSRLHILGSKWPRGAVLILLRPVIYAWVNLVVADPT